MNDVSRLIVLTDISLREFDRLWSGVATPTVSSNGQVFHVLTSLATSARINVVSLLRSYYIDDQSGTAAACRNLLELAIFTKYVLKSRSHLLEFAADRLIDGLQLAEGLKGIDQQLNPETTSSIADEAIAVFKAQLSSENIDRRKFLRMEELADTVGMKSEYTSLNRVCSKFVHPTSWSLLTLDRSLERFPFACELFLGQGSMLFSTVYADMKNHLKTNGLSFANE